MKKIFKLTGLIIAGIVTFFAITFILWLAINAPRTYFQVGDMTFTFWKKWGGVCYVMPYKYTGLCSPKKDYIKIPIKETVCGIMICVDKDTRELTIVGGKDSDYEIFLPDYKYTHMKDPTNASIDIIHESDRLQDQYLESLSPGDIWINANILYSKYYNLSNQIKEKNPDSKE